MSNQPPFRRTHVLNWRYEDVEPLIRALREYGFRRGEIILKVSGWEDSASPAYVLNI